jgi:predicted HicB family RNase H-like nuclease
MNGEDNINLDRLVSKRINVTLPDSVVDELENWAEAQGRSLANLAAFLLEMSLKQAKERGEYPDRDIPANPNKER